ncbi:hypothetical protein FHX15_001761 [Rhizobium sp. BK650]|uniref:hypothetical protein n=1 Tax=Rhizobium sp. BK650 TaxID=2586990 RepID=UPI00161EEF07|nr:hypothetical protein [Rhizobium sp. BK650]MBB3656533.1 hypothetical protein [Rhizobium sp. BK650]
MFLSSAPWTIGPLPIIATLWAGYVLAAAILSRQSVNTKVVVSTFAFFVGLVPLASQLWIVGNFGLVLVVNQFLIAVAFVSSLIFINIQSSNPQKVLIKDLDINDISKKTLFILVVLGLIDFLFIYFRPTERCNAGRCALLEMLIGSRSSIFGSLYFADIFGSSATALALVGFYAILVNLIRRSRQRR